MKIPNKAVKIPQRNVAMSDVRRWQRLIVVSWRRFSVWCRNFYLHRTIWLEIAILVMTAGFASWLLYHFFYAQPRESLLVPETSIKLDVSRIETLRAWGRDRQRAADTGIRVPEIVFRESL